ncbi:MAG TPA: hypothetical protein VMU78_00115 [Methylocella sp.]|nr:hypothetical protein [Methylocella sp.]
MCLPLGAASPMMPDGRFAFLVIGIPCLVSGWICVLLGWAEFVSRVDIREDGSFSFRLPRYRGYLPFLGLQRLEGSWKDVRRLSRRRVRGSILLIPYRFVRHAIETSHGNIAMLAFERGDLVRNANTASQNISTAEIAALFSTRTGLSPVEEPECRVGLVRSLIGGGSAE